MKLNIREKIFVIGLILSLTIYLTINAVSYWNTKRHIESRVNVEKTLVIISEYENLISMVKDAETGQRGFIITGDWTFLEPYYNGVTAVHQSMKLLRKLTPIDAQAYQKLGNIEGMIEKRFEQFHKTIGLRKEGYIAAAIKSVMTDKDEKIMFDIRTLVEEMKNEKINLLQTLNRISEVRSSRTLFTILIGNLIAFLFVFFSFIQLYRDITERKRAEEMLKKSEENYRRLFESLPVAIYQVDFKTGKFIKANATLCEYVGCSQEEIISHSPYDSLTDESKQLFLERISKMSLGEKVTETPEYEIIDKNGRCLWLQFNSKNIYDSEGLIGADVVAHDITERKRADKQIQDTLESLRKSFGTIIQVMVSAVETRDPYTAGHQVRSANIARAIATEMGLPQEKIDGIRMAGSIHDIGKLSVPAEILSKPGKLLALEFSLIKEHARKGYEMLKNVESPWPLAQIVYQHHERMNGSGYPRGLKGEDIIMEARIMAVADVVESMASHRPYRPALGINAALEEIEKNKGILYDDAVADACLRLFREKGFQI